MTSSHFRKMYIIYNNYSTDSMKGKEYETDWKVYRKT